MPRPVTSAILIALLLSMVAFQAGAFAPAAEPAGPIGPVSWSFSTDGGKTFTDNPLPQIKPGEVISIVAKAKFTPADPARIGGMWITTAGKAGGITLAPAGEWRCPILLDARVTLNGKPTIIAFPNLTYEKFLLDPAALVQGENVLTVRGRYANWPMKFGPSEPLVPSFVLTSVECKDVEFHSGPVLGAIGLDYFTVTCRSSTPATVIVKARPVSPDKGEEVTAESQRGVFHRFRVPLPKGTQVFSYSMTARAGVDKTGKTVGPIAVKVPGSSGGKLRFAAFGQSDGGAWPKVVAAVSKTAPDLVIHTGTLNYFPKLEFSWNGILPPPEVRKLTSAVPFYAVRGWTELNHPIYDRMFYSPTPDGTGDNWTQVIGNVRLIGIHGYSDWSAGSANAKWLEAVLKASGEKFVFVLSHYPAYSSARWVRPPLTGVLLQCRNVISPLLGKYNATALISSFGHHYERCEPAPDKGATCIVTAAAGGMTRKRSNRATANNPFSKVYHGRTHYCVFEVEGDACTMKAFSLHGQQLDEKTWKARTAGK